MALYLCLNEDGTGIVSEANPIQTKHTSNGEPVVVPVYLVNDGKRSNVANDTNPPELIYTNIQVKIEGVGYTLESQLTASTSDVTIQLTGVDGWNIGTIIKSGLERMRIEEILSSTSVRVQRNYSADGRSSTIQTHNIGAAFISETLDVSLALPSTVSQDTEGVFNSGGVALTQGFDPTSLSGSIGSAESANQITSSNGSLYSEGNLIKIDNETMKILSISGDVLTVQRGYRSNRAAHASGSVIYCVGIRDIGVTHKFYIKNDPPSGLPTQKKKDIKIVLVSDEEPA